MVYRTYLRRFGDGLLLFYPHDIYYYSYLLNMSFGFVLLNRVCHGPIILRSGKTMTWENPCNPRGSLVHGSISQFFIVKSP
jgi:hypothetical protein